LLMDRDEMFILMDNTLKPVSYIEQMYGSLFSWNTS
jgi:hypothetical protein